MMICVKAIPMLQISLITAYTEDIPYNMKGCVVSPCRESKPDNKWPNYLIKKDQH